MVQLIWVYRSIGQNLFEIPFKVNSLTVDTRELCLNGWWGRGSQSGGMEAKSDPPDAPLYRPGTEGRGVGRTVSVQPKTTNKQMHRLSQILLKNTMKCNKAKKENWSSCFAYLSKI